MNILCPQCQFSRDVPDDRLPASSPGRAVVATCPRCGHRFQVFPAGHGAGDGGEARPIRDARAAGHAEEDPRAAASRAYAREAGRGREMDSGRGGRPADGNPWDMAPHPDGLAAAFYQTVVRVMFGASRFFAGLDDDAPHLRPLAFFLIVGVISVSAQLFWLDVARGTLMESSDPQVRALLESLPQGNAILSGILQIFGLVVQLYLLSGLLYLSFRLGICRTATYSLVFQIVAYASAPVLLSVIPVAGYLAGLVWSVAAIVTGCQASMRLSWGQAVAGCLPMILILLILLRQIMGMSPPV